MHICVKTLVSGVISFMEERTVSCNSLLLKGNSAETLSASAAKESGAVK